MRRGHVICTGAFLAVFSALMLGLVGCGGGSGDEATPPPSTTSAQTDAPTTEPTATTVSSESLRIALSIEVSSADPEVFYEAEGLTITNSVYEGLVRYKAGSTEIEPLLAESYEVSDDGTVYTFHLRDGVTFHDGTPFDSEAAKASFERRIDVAGGPSYMLADVASMDTPDPLTFVVTLKQPVSPFLHYLASPYGPKMYSPAVVAEQSGDDFGQEYFRTHEAGSGPYTLTTFEPTRYVMERFDDYWGAKPYFKTVEMVVTPDFTTQRLMLEGGEIDIMLHGLPVDQIDEFRTKEGFQVSDQHRVAKTFIMVNPNNAPFDDPTLRAAFRSAVDKVPIVDAAYGKRATVSTQIYPSGEVPDGLAVDDAPYDPATLKAAAEAAGVTSVEIVFQSADPAEQRAAELLGIQLQEAGITATTRGVPVAEIFNYPKDPEAAPSLLLVVSNPDAAHPDTWARVFNYTAAPVNLLSCSVPEADKLVDQGLREPDSEKSLQLYGMAGDLYAESGCWVTIADVQDAFIAREGITGFDEANDIASYFSLRVAELRGS